MKRIFVVITLFALAACSSGGTSNVEGNSQDQIPPAPQNEGVSYVDPCTGDTCPKFSQGANSPNEQSVFPLQGGFASSSWEGSILDNDGDYASNDSELLSGRITDYLGATDFGFNVPTNATIRGIVVEYDKGTLGDSQVFDTYVYLVLNGNIIGTDRSNPDPWPHGGTDFVIYGSSTDLWATDLSPIYLSPEDVNDPSFGVVISASSLPPNGALVNEVVIDFVRMTVFYD